MLEHGNVMCTRNVSDKGFSEAVECKTTERTSIRMYVSSLSITPIPLSYAIDIHLPCLYRCLAFPASTYLPSPFSFNHSISIQILHSSPRYNILFNNVPHKFSRTLESCLSLQLPSSQLFCLRFCFCFCFCLTPIKRHSRQNKIKLPVVQQATFITLVYAFLAVSHSLFPSLCYLSLLPAIIAFSLNSKSSLFRLISCLRYSSQERITHRKVRRDQSTRARNRFPFSDNSCDR